VLCDAVTQESQEGDPEQGACVRHPELGHDHAGGARPLSRPR
jgi:hypothetical protein